MHLTPHDVVRMRRNVKAVHILAMLVAGASILGGAVVLVLTARLPPDHPVARENLALGQTMLTHGVVWVMLWLFLFTQFRRLARHCESSLPPHNE